jgi:probable FeS assembly SUF system protein SufT
MENIELKRDCNVIAIPSGLSQVLPSGTSVRVVQTRGGSYTIAAQFHAMYRIDAADADALGFEVPAAPDPGQQEPFSEKLVWNTLRKVFDPEIPINIVDLGLVYSFEIHPCERGKAINVRMSMTAPGCGMSNVLKTDVESKLLQIPDVAGVYVEVVFDPPWNPERMSEAARLQLGIDLAPSSPPDLTKIT